MLMKKWTAAVCAAAVLMSGTAFAATEGAEQAQTQGEEIGISALSFDGGSGTEEDPYLISNEAQLIFVADLPGKCFKLANDIELENDWVPIGAYGEAFSGTFDGGGFTISNMVVADGSGFFSKVTGTVKNLNVEGEVTSTNQYAGGIAGQSSGTFENCSFSGTVKSNYESYPNYIGGLIGYNSGTVSGCGTNGTISVYVAYSQQTYAGGLIGYSKGAVSDSYSDCAVTNGGRSGGLIGYSSAAVSDCYAAGIVGGNDAGGLIGYSDGCVIKKCYATGNIATTFSDGGNAAGGLVGYMKYGSIRLSYATGNVEPYTNDEGTTYKFEYGGGLVGYANSYSGDIENCYASGSAEATSNAGGLIGHCDRNYYDVQKIINCYSFGKPNASRTRGLIGDYDSSYTPTVTSCYYDSQTSGCTDTGYGSPKTTSGMKNQLVYDGWDFENIWGIDESEARNSGYPYLLWELEKKVRVSKITLDRTSAEVKMGSSFTLVPTAEGENTEGIPYTWTSSDKTIASVDNGTVIGKNIGTAVITAAYGSVSASCTVTVLDSRVKVTSVTLDKSDAGIVVNETVQLTASVLPEDATDKGITWTSTNGKIASVSSSGLVTGVAEGTAQIRAVSDSNSACYAVCDITVAKERIPVTGIEMNASPFGTPFEVNIGRTLVLSPTVKPENATNKTIIWTSNNESVASVSNGAVTGVAEGTTTITATTADGGYSASCTVKVTKPTVYVTGIVLNTEQLTVKVKETKKLAAAVTPADATDKTITFKSNNNAIASVSDDGTVTGVSAGTTLIQAISDTSAGKFIAFCTVTVPKPVVEVTSVKLDKGAVEIVEGKTVPVKAVIKPSNATYKNITWSTSDESIATVSQDGYITAQGVGEAVISATAVNGVNTVCSVTVLSSDTPAQLKVEDATVKAGKQVEITVSIAANPGISTFNFDLTYNNAKLYPVSYTKGNALENVNVVTPLGTMSFKDKNSVRFLCSTSDSKNMDSDGDLITVVFQTLSGIEYGEETIGIVPAAFTNQNYEAINLREDNCTLDITDYIIGDVNNDDTVDLKDSMILGQYIAGFGIELTPQGRRAAVNIYPETGDDAEAAEPSINDFQHLFRYLSDWQVELGKK